jgi:2-polyprenyl-3-methyl-5-hydroxy-6-metoxy-1,4-benzoquinol methylase
MANTNYEAQSGSQETDLDGASKIHWDNSYKVKLKPALWCDEPVPFAADAVALLTQENSKLVLELPCGDGKNTQYLARHFPFLIAADYSSTGLEIAANRLVHHNGRNSNVLFCKVDIFDSQFLSNQFDAIFCCDLLGHLENSEAALRELVRMCRPEGVIVINVFAIDDSTRTVEKMVRLRGEEYIYADKFYFRFFSRTEALDLCRGVNAQVLSIHLAKWMEGPHEGYREYPHEHQSWVLTLRKDKV